MATTLSFDRGTLRVDGDVAPFGDLVRFDARTGFHRAAAYHYARLRQVAQDRSVALDDRLIPAWVASRRRIDPPTLRPYQEQALTAFQRFGRRGMIVPPTGSGKTRLACAAVATTGVSTLVLVPTRVLLEQWVAVLRELLGDPIGILLPERLALTTSAMGRPGRVVPRYLTARDEVWIRLVLELFDGFVGRPAGERDAVIDDRARRLTREHGASPLAAAGVARVVGRRYRTEVATTLRPPAARAVVFEEAARSERFDRSGALERAASRLTATAEEVERALFADRPCRRRIVAPSSPLDAAGIVDAYNLALVQGLLLRSEYVTVDVREHTRAVVRFAKLAGLLCTCAVGARGTRLEVSGPLAILRHTTKYGFALATFFPAVVATAGYRVEARCLLRGEPRVVHIDAGDRIARTHKLPKDADSAVERVLARDLRRLGTPWTLTRESEAITVGDRIFFPDFTLRHTGGFSALVEIVGYYTPEYLRSKLAALRGVAGRPLIACVDESLACDDGEVAGAVMRYRKRVDAARLIELAEAMRRGLT